MTEQSNAELIVEVIEKLASHQWMSDWGIEMLAGILAERLEAADQRAELAEANLSVEESKNAGYRAKNNQLAAVVEKVRAYAREMRDRASMNAQQGGEFWQGMAIKGRESADDLDALLATAPAGILREHEAALIEKLADEWHADNTGTSPRAYNWLNAKARQRREDQS